jgi:acetolactate synthase regulatory subunit
MKIFSILLILSVCSLIKSELDIEKIVYRLNGMTFHLRYETPFESASCKLNLLPFFNPKVLIDPVDKVFHVEFADIEPYKEDYETVNQSIAKFDKDCHVFGKIIKFSDKNKKIHFNLNQNDNGGFVLKKVQTEDSKDGKSWVVSLDLDQDGLRSFMLVTLEIEKLRPEEETKLLANYFTELIN